MVGQVAVTRLWVSRAGAPSARPSQPGPAIPSPHPFDPPRTIAVELLADAAGVREG